MNKYDEAYYKTVVSILAHMFQGNENAKEIFETADWRAGIIHRAKRDEQNPNSPLLDTSNKTENPQYEEILHFITIGESGAKKVLKDLKKWLSEATQITICDPYVLKGPGAKIYSSEEDYIDYFSSLFPASATKIKIFGNGFKTSIRKKMKAKLKEGRSITFFDTNMIHDRYIIKDNTEGRMIGTSFGGLGNKVFTVLELPKEDVVTLSRYLRKIEQQEPLE